MSDAHRRARLRSVSAPVDGRKKTACDQAGGFLGQCAGTRAGVASFLRGRRAAVRGRPFGRCVQEFLDFVERLRLEVAGRLRDAQHVPPRGERVQVDVDVLQDRHAFLEDVVVEQHEAVVHRRARGAQRVDEVDLAAAVGGQVFHQQHARAFFQMAFDLRVAAETLRLFTHVLHRHHHPVRDPGRERDAGRLAARHRVDLLEADVARDRRFRHFHQRTAHARIRDQLAAVDIDGACPAGREDERFFGIEVHRLHFEQDFGGRIRDRLTIVACHGHSLGDERGAGAGPMAQQGEPARRAGARSADQSHRCARSPLFYPIQAGFRRNSRGFAMPLTTGETNGARPSDADAGDAAVHQQRSFRGCTLGGPKKSFSTLDLPLAIRQGSMACRSGASRAVSQSTIPSIQADAAEGAVY
ncbi:hypothetical protein BCEN4_630017 [Burkholderia cenocepacia]|nr:hypothetical protein BCEN4_630017 [Burkholderia cenocepacia]